MGRISTLPFTALTPAAISHQVKGLEEYLGVALFRRVGRGPELTDASIAALPRLSRVATWTS